MSNSIQSVLIFNGYSISNMKFERNYDYQSQQEMELNFDFEVHSHISDEKDEAVLQMTCNIFEEEYKTGDAPFYLELTLNAYFGVDGQVDIERFQVNGMAILLPYLRSIITSFTSQAGISPVILPTINVYSFFNNKIQNEE